MNLKDKLAAHSYLVAAPILLFLAMSAWAVSSPVGSSPDDDFHLASIWCGLGDRDGLCEPAGPRQGDDLATPRLVPGQVAEASSCFRFQPEQSAACAEPAPRGLEKATWLNSDGLYPPLFYATMSVFASGNVDASVITMRVFNAALYVGLVSAVFIALPRSLRSPLTITVLGTIVPLGLFIIPSTNPSSWALLSATTVWVSLFGAWRSTGRRQQVLCGLAVVGAVLGAGARADAAAFAVFGVLLAGILGLRRGLPWKIPTLTSAFIVVLGAVGYLTAGQSDLAADGLPGGASRSPLSVSQHLSNFLQVPDLWMGALGSWGLGWIDTPLPAVVRFLAVGALFGALLIGVGYLGRRGAVATGLALTALWVAPLVMLAQTSAVVGELIQPRYILPILIMTVGVATSATDGGRSWTVPRVLFVGMSLAVANAVALHVNIMRYTRGLTDTTFDPGANAEWWWGGPLSPLAVLLIGSAAFAGVFLVLAHEVWRRGARQRDEPADPDGPALPRASDDVEQRQSVPRS